MTADQIAAAHAETERLTHELDITNADHIALWLEANMADSSLAWLACRIVEAHEAAISEPASVAVEAETLIAAGFDDYAAHCALKTESDGGFCHAYFYSDGQWRFQTGGHDLTIGKDTVRCVLTKRLYAHPPLSKPTPVEAGLREAVSEVLKWRVGDLPDKGYIRDNDASRTAIGKMVAALSETQPPRETSTETKESGDA